MYVDGVPYTVWDALTVLPSTLSAHTPAVVTPAPQKNDQHVVETDQWHAVVHQPQNTADISEKKKKIICFPSPLSLPSPPLPSYLVVEKTGY